MSNSKLGSMRESVMFDIIIWVGNIIITCYDYEHAVKTSVDDVIKSHRELKGEVITFSMTL